VNRKNDGTLFFWFNFGLKTFVGNTNQNGKSKEHDGKEND